MRLCREKEGGGRFSEDEDDGKDGQGEAAKILAAKRKETGPVRASAASVVSGDFQDPKEAADFQDEQKGGRKGFNPTLGLSFLERGKAIMFELSSQVRTYDDMVRGFAKRRKRKFHATFFFDVGGRCDRYLSAPRSYFTERVAEMRAKVQGED